MAKYLYILVIVILSAHVSFAQMSQNDRRMLKTANNYFNNEQFTEALPIYLRLDSLGGDFLIKYHIGACYLNTDYEKLKALPFLEEVSNSSDIEVPIVVYKDLGTLYHYMYRFDNAIVQFNKYLSKAKNDDFAEAAHISYVNRMIEICNNAIEITTQKFKADVDILERPINTMESEYCPMITADERMMVYMQTIGIGKKEKTETNILISHKNKNGFWSDPIKLIINNVDKYKGKKIRLAGLSPDGQILFLNIGSKLDQDIYSAKITDSVIEDIKKLNKNINSDFFEGRVSISPDGTELFFVSDRPGGYGRTDIYKSTLSRRNEWGEPENLGSIINTRFNENSPFMHPDNQTLLFSSEGHKTIGGNDIFKSKFNGKLWSFPENLGFPNSTKDDLYFVLNANGQTGYFSSSKNNIFDKHNIFKANFKDPIPLTLVKGTIKAGYPAKPIAADIKVYDKETGERVKYIYSPDPETGKYLMIFPPAKNYDLIISSEDFLPQLVNVYIPYQTYFYELYQEITLNTINLDNKQVGEQITINNTFYDLYKTSAADSILLEDLPKEPKYYDHLLELVETIIQTTDTMKINYIGSEHEQDKQNEDIEHLLDLIEDAIETTDPVTLSILDANAQQKDKVKATHFYIDGKKEKSGEINVFGNDTIYTAPAISSNKNNATLEPITNISIVEDIDKEPVTFKSSTKEERNYIHQIIVYYALDEDKIPTSYYDELEQTCKLLLNNPLIGAEIYGFADSKGKEQHNLNLSRQRAQNVLRFFIDKKVTQKKLITKGFGEKEATKQYKNQKYFRKVEINIFELKTD